MILFGGIQEITKEINDFYLYDFKTNTWITLFEETASPKKLPEGFGSTLGGEQSPMAGSPKKSSNSPNGKNSSFRKTSPPKTLNKSLMKSTFSPIKKNLNISTF